jgi:hypothetical protein
MYFFPLNSLTSLLKLKLVTFFPPFSNFTGIYPSSKRVPTPVGE